MKNPLQWVVLGILIYICTSCATGCQQLKKINPFSPDYVPDNPAEELLEGVIERELHVPLDLTPSSPEK